MEIQVVEFKRKRDSPFESGLAIIKGDNIYVVGPNNKEVRRMYQFRKKGIRQTIDLENGIPQLAINMEVKSLVSENGCTSDPNTCNSSHCDFPKCLTQEERVIPNNLDIMAHGFGGN
jgi:hypothetical protein